MIKDSMDKKIVKYGIKKFSFGIVSVVIGALVFLGGTVSAHDENSKDNNITITNANISKEESSIARNIENTRSITSEQILNSSNESSIVNKNSVDDSTSVNSKVLKPENHYTATSSDSSNNNLNVIDKRVDDSNDIASLLTKIINKNSEENKQINETAESTEAVVEKGTKIISRLTLKYAEDIAKGYIGLEGGKYDSLIYKKAVLNPDGDDDGDGIANKDELYIYKKDGRTYLGYDIHPRLADTDGDGLNDKDDKDKLLWNVSARDMAMFINLVYENDKKIDDILKNEAPSGTLTNNLQKMTNNELGPYWRVKQTYHQDNGLDAVLFETTNKYPFSKGNKIQVLAFAGTNVAQAGDLKADVALFFGNESNQSEATIELIKKLKNDKTITNLYITGHSLGGYLSLRATATAEKNNFDAFKETYTFNAPKVKSGWFWGVPDADVKIAKELAKTGKIKNYYTDNDNIIPGNLQPENRISVGKSAGAHSSTSYFENRMNTNKDFNFGKRQGMDGIGYRDKNINNLSIIDPENGTLSKTFLPSLIDDKPVSIMIGEKLNERDVLNKINRNILPVNTKLSIVSQDELTTLGIKHAKVKVLYLDDNTSNNIDVPISVTEADKKELISVVNAAQKLVDTVVDLSDKTIKSVENYNRAKSNLSEKLGEAVATISNSLSPQSVINNIAKEVANLGMNVINTRAALELTEAGKYTPRITDEEKILLHQGSRISLDTVINKIVKDNMPQNLSYEILNIAEFTELGDVAATVKVTYSDNSFDIVKVPVRVYTDSKGESLVQENNPELVLSEKGDSLIQEKKPELVLSEKGESLVQENKPELVLSEKGESLVQENNPELVISEKGESLVQEEKPELVISEKGEALVQEGNPELVVSGKGDSLVQEEKPQASVESLRSLNLGVEVELLSDIKNISLNVMSIKNRTQLESISRSLFVKKDKVRVLDLKLSKNTSVLNINNKRIVRIALLDNESDKINIYHIEKNGKLTLIPSKVKNRVVQFNIDHFSLFAIVDFSRTNENNQSNEEKQIVLETKNQQSFSSEIMDKKHRKNKVTNNDNLNSKIIEISNINDKKEIVNNNLLSSNRDIDKTIVVEKNNFKKNSFLPKTGDIPSSEVPIVAGLGLIIGLLGNRKFNR